MYNRTKPLTSSAVMAQILADLASCSNTQKNDIAQKLEQIRLQSETLDEYVSSLPTRLRETRASHAWTRYAKEKEALRPSEHTAKIGAVIYHLDHSDFRDEDKPSIEKYKSMLKDLKSEFNEDFVREWSEMNKPETTAFTPTTSKSEKELLQEQINRLETERKQAAKENRPDEAARISILIKQCEIRLFHKPIRHAEIENQKRITSQFYFESVTGKNVGL